MSLDRTIVFKRLHPSSDDLLAVCEDYFGGSATVSVDHGAIFAVLPGDNSYALRRVGRATKAQRGFWVEAHGAPRERWIEVYRNSAHSVSVVTRQHDELTNAVALGLAEVIAHGWAGEVEP